MTAETSIHVDKRGVWILSRSFSDGVAHLILRLDSLTLMMNSQKRASRTGPVSTGELSLIMAENDGIS